MSALLLCAPYTDRGIELSLEGGVVSAPYIDLTIAVMEDFGVTISKPERFAYRVNAGEPYRGRRYVVEGDASSASYFFLAAALLKTTIRVEGISRESRQETSGCWMFWKNWAAGSGRPQTEWMSPGEHC